MIRNSDAIDLFDSEQVSYVASGKLAEATVASCATDRVNNKCYVFGSKDRHVEVISVNLETNQFTVSNYSTPYPSVYTRLMACIGIGEVIYCAGGVDLREEAGSRPAPMRSTTQTRVVDGTCFQFHSHLTSVLTLVHVQPWNDTTFALCNGRGT